MPKEITLQNKKIHQAESAELEASSRQPKRGRYISLVIGSGNPTAWYSTARLRHVTGLADAKPVTLLTNGQMG